MKVCSKCIYDENVFGINFDENDVCNYCKQIDVFRKEYGTGTKLGKIKFDQIINEIKSKNKNKKYNVIVGVSGGIDSSFMLHLAIKFGLKPLAVHYDNTWNTAISSQNIKKMVTKLNIDLFTYVIDCKEQDEILKSFMKAGICGVDAATDLAYAEVLYRVAHKFGVRYVFEGHSFQEEGVSPIGHSYTDGKFIESVVKRYSNIKLRSYPLMTFISFLKWVVLLRIKKIRPFWYIDYTKEKARTILEKEYDWKYYGGHHLENRIAAFDHSYLMPKKFNVDQRNNSLSARVRSGNLDRKLALKEYSKPPFIEKELINYVKKRLNIKNDEFQKIMNGKKNTFEDFKTYKNLFEKFRLLFFILQKINLVPSSFYRKYCFPIKVNNK